LTWHFRSQWTAICVDDSVLCLKGAENACYLALKMLVM
jgi:hypothetical protein